MENQIETPTVENDNEKLLKKEIKPTESKEPQKVELDIQLDAAQKLQKIRESLEKEKTRLQKEKEEKQKIIDSKIQKNENEVITWFNKWINDKNSKFDYASWSLEHLNYSQDFFTDLETKLKEKGFKCYFEFKASTHKKGDYFYLYPYFTVALSTYKPKYVSTYEDIKNILKYDNCSFKSISIKTDDFKSIDIKGDVFEKTYFVYNISTN